MRVAVFQHAAVEHPGILRDFFAADGHRLETFELDAGDVIPDLGRFDMMLVMGGPQDVWQKREFPWLVDEIAAIRRFVVDLQRPYLGICLGHQLLAEAIGGKVGKADTPEVGVMTIAKTAAGHADPFFDGISDTLAVLQWHGAEVQALPSGASILATSPACAIQAFRYGRYAYGMQCHVEVHRDSAAEWAAIPEYAAALESALGQGALPKLTSEVEGSLANFNRAAQRLYTNFMAIARVAAIKAL